MAGGYIKLHRKILENMLWTEKPFDYAHAWLDLLLLANYKDLQVIRRGQVVDRKRGEVNTSIGYLADRWGWSKNKVRNYLSILKGTGMCTPEGTPHGTTLRIENYSKYQGDAHTEGTPKGTTEGTPKGTPEGTHDKKDKESNKKEKNYARGRVKNSSSFSEILEELRKEYELEESGDDQPGRTS